MTGLKAIPTAMAALLLASTIVAPPATAQGTQGAPLKVPKLSLKKEPKPPKPVEQPLPGSVLTASEMALDCKKMAGRMQIRILEHRGGGPTRGSSSIAQGLQSAVVPLAGGSQRGADAAAERDNDIVKLKAMNAILVSKNCPHYDIDAELAKDAKAPSPRLIRASGSKAQKPARAKPPAGKDQPAGKGASVAPPKT